MIDYSQLVSEAKTLLAYVGKTKIPYVSNGMTLSGMDCQGLMEHLLIQCGMKKEEVNLAGSNAHWRKSLKWCGTVEEAVKLFGCIPEGAWLFIHTDGYNSKYKDNDGNASHVGQFISGTQAIHASSSRGQVAESYIGKKSINGGWNYVCLCKWVKYADAVEAKLGGSQAADVQSGSSNSNTDGKVTITMTTAKVKTTNGKLNMRDAASKAGKQVGEISNGATVTVLEKTNTEYWKISYNGTTAYAACAYLVEVATVTMTLDKDTVEALYAASGAALGK